MVLPAMGPDCHLVRTAIPPAPRQDSLGDFHHSQTVSYPLLQTGFQGNSAASLAGETGASTSLSTLPTQGRLLCTQRYGGKAG